MPVDIRAFYFSRLLMYISQRRYAEQLKINKEDLPDLWDI